MSRVAYVEGQYLPHRFAAVHVEDRGYRFADGVYDDEGHVTEGASTNSWTVTADGSVITRWGDAAILDGVSRLAVLDLIHRVGYRVLERSFTVAEARSASEACLTSTTAELLPVVKIDGEPVGGRVPDSITPRLRALYLMHATAAA